MMKNFSLIVKSLNVLFLVFFWGFTMVTFFKLPSVIPTHFGFDNKADAFGSRNMVWMLPVISTVLFLLLDYLAKNPHSPLLNIPDSMRKNPKISELFIRGIQFFLILVFAQLTFEVSEVSLSGKPEISNTTFYILGTMFLYLILMIIFSHTKVTQQKNKEF